MKLGFQDPRVWESDAHVEAECARQGVRDPHLIAARKAAARAQDAELLAQCDESVLPVLTYRRLLASNLNPQLTTPEAIDGRRKLMLDLLTQRLASVDAEARVAAINERLVKQCPALNAALNARGAGWDVPILRDLADRFGAVRSDGGGTPIPAPEGRAAPLWPMTGKNR